MKIPLSNKLTPNVILLSDNPKNSYIIESIKIRKQPEYKNKHYEFVTEVTF